MQPFRPPAARVTRALIIACLIVQLLLTLSGNGDAAALSGGLIPARLTGGVDLPGAPPALLTLISSLFIHSGWLHLGMNLLMLGYLGRPVEWVLGPGRFLALYLGGGVAGGLAQVAAGPSGIEPVIGASGAIAAVLAVYAALFAQRRAKAVKLAGVAVSAELLNALWLAAAWIGVQLLTGAVLNAGGGGGGIAIWAHVGGFVAGLLLARPLAKGARVRPV